MAKFTVRVQLESAGIDEYPAFHDAMSQAGFDKTIFGKKKQMLNRLPQAEYTYSAEDMTASEVLAKVNQIAKSTGRNCGILVTEAKKRVWRGLATEDVEDETDE